MWKAESGERTMPSRAIRAPPARAVNPAPLRVRRPVSGCIETSQETVARRAPPDAPRTARAGVDLLS